MTGRTCHYSGFLATGVTSRETRPIPAATDPDDERVRFGEIRTTYGPFLRARRHPAAVDVPQGRDPTPQGQTVTVMLQGEYVIAPTLTALIAGQRAYIEALGGSWGDELPTLVPLSVQLLLYHAASEPDLTMLAPGSHSRPQQLDRAEVGHVGWRVGAALRTYRHEATGTREPAPRSPSGWRLPPHIRKAHWHRVRVATRDDAGVIVGDRLGVEGVDWTHELRLYPPTPDNATDAGTDPAVRAVDPRFDQGASQVPTAKTRPLPRAVRRTAVAGGAI